MRLAPGNLHAAYRQEAAALLRHVSAAPLLVEEDLHHLPPLVARFLRFVGVVGAPRVYNLHATMQGELHPAPGAPALHFHVEQTSTFGERARLFSMRARKAFIPFTALHRYVGSTASMQVKLAGLIEIVNAAGPEMNQSETVTMFNDMCLLAPATLIDPTINWSELAADRVGATFRNAGNTITAELTFAEDGSLVLFTSDDRFQSADGKTYLRYRWSTPIAAYGSYHGFRLPARAQAAWRQPGGEYVYARSDIVDVTYNVTAPLARTRGGARAGRQ